MSELYEKSLLKLELDQVLALLAECSDGLTMDKIAEITGLSIAKLSAMLLNMELSGLVRQLPGKIYVIC